MDQNDILDNQWIPKKNEKFTLFRKSKHSEGIYQIAEILKSNNIKHQLIDNSVTQELNYADTLHNETELKLKPSDFERANELIKNSITVSLDQYADDYYLFEFDNDELFEILLKPDEWGDVDYMLSKLILKKRGVDVNEDLIKSLRTQRIKELKKPESAQNSIIIAGFIFALLGGLIGLLIGWYISTAKKTLPNGEKVYSFDKKDRLKGKVILIIGLIVFPIVFYLRLLKERG